MTLRLFPGPPDRGINIDAEDGSSVDEGDHGPVDIHVEGRPWGVVAPIGSPPSAVQIVDGVRRVESYAIDDLDDGTIAYGLFGSYAVGAVRCEGSHSWVLDGGPDSDPQLRIERVYLHSGGTPGDQEIAAGSTQLRFRASLSQRASTPSRLINALQDSMLDGEALLAERLANDESMLTIVDGPLRLRTGARRVAGYVKRVQDWYIDPPERALLAELAAGERTPLFLIPGGGKAGRRGRPDRYAWYLRIADIGEQFHHLAGIVRLEAPAALPRDRAVRLADECALALPRFASSPIRDPRAPQNLTPVGALEQTLHRRLGDREWVRRLIAAALGARPRPGAATEGSAQW